MSSVRWFEELGLADVPLVGGKTASLGELYRLLKGSPIAVPNGFAVTAQAYRDALTSAEAWEPLRAALAGLDVRNVVDLSRRAAQARRIVYEATGGAELREEIAAAFRRLQAETAPGLSVAVRSSATAEDLPTASFAGQHDSFLHVRDEAALFEACRRCFASLFTDRAIVYRVNNGFDHFKVYLSVAVMRMVSADEAASGVAFTLDTESGFPDVVFVTGVWGLGENIVQGKVSPDEFYVHKPTLKQGFRAVLKRSLGEKATRLAWRGRTGEMHAYKVARRDRDRFCLTDAEVLDLAEVAARIEDHYSAAAGRWTPMDIEWAKDAGDGRLYILQARPETVASQRPAGEFETYRRKGKGQVLAAGKAVGEKIASGRVRRVHTAADLKTFRPGEVLVTPSTSPDWVPVMRSAAAIVTDQGGRTCHAAIVARELGVPAVVGAGDASSVLQDGQLVTVSCAEGETGQIFEGEIAFEVDRLSLASLPRPRTKVMLNLAQPDLAFRTALLPADGVGLARLEFIIGEQVRIHPMAAVHPDRVTSARERREIARLARHDASPADYVVRKIAEGVGVIAAAFYPRPVIVRLSDFKTNEYAELLGGAAFEPVEENPMLGFRGAARYAHPSYADGFALECRALRKVRDELGLTNLKVMVPFCRRVQEGEQVLQAMAANGVARGEKGLEVYVMCEIPNNVIQADAFAQLFDGFSIGSNDLTQLVLGVDRDSEMVAFDFDERDPGVMTMLRQAVEGAHRNSRPVGICGEAPATYPEVAEFLTRLGVDSISVNPSSLPRTLSIVARAEEAAPSA
ncbi:MAG: phosphoenolpyruvate synthase [Phenylobacterium sp.]|jgi:pyruvate,water dikinase|uniref:phosphoenolpyruvate synthase n=1 Tax=Phenylobacterium sp. TaxID=1871053 RepID=UPI002A36104F|nr:phosphoenolpyruvate synthase [Phenylobacterium sp.]MDX9999218.1 phosphoenolpyruvate synthase [Phenylobacterium sp.]